MLKIVSRYYFYYISMRPDISVCNVFNFFDISYLLLSIDNNKFSSFFDIPSLLLSIGIFFSYDISNINKALILARLLYIVLSPFLIILAILLQHISTNLLYPI